MEIPGNLHREDILYDYVSMGCNSSVEISLEVEYAAKGPNGYGFQDNVSENGVYTFRVDASNSWDCEFSPEKRKFYLYALPPLTTKVKKVDIAANIDVATSEGSENISDFKISLAVIDAQGSIISSSVLLDKVDVNRNILLPFSQDSEVVKTAKVGCRYKIMCTAGAGNAVVKVTISALQICVVSAKDHVAPVRPPFEESVTEDSAIFSLYSPRPWCWGSTKARAINWVSTPILSSGCSKIVASFIIDIDHALDPAKASTYFNAASLDLVLVRHGKVISSEQILFVNQAAIEMAKNKPLQHSIDHTSRKSSRKLLAKCSPGTHPPLLMCMSTDSGACLQETS